MKNTKIIILSLIAIPLFFSSCILHLDDYDGHGPMVTQSYNMRNVTGIKVTGSFNVVVEQGSTQIIEATGHQNILNRLDLTVDNNDLEIELLPGFYPDLDLTVYVTLPNLEYVNINGSGDVELYSFEDLTYFEAKINGSGDLLERGPMFVDGPVEVKINGSGDARLDLSCTSFKYTQNGSGDLRISGETYSQDLKLVGSGNFKGFDFYSVNCDVNILGSGDALIRASEKLNANIYGSGDISYKDNPVINFNSAGSGRLRSAN